MRLRRHEIFLIGYRSVPVFFFFPVNLEKVPVNILKKVHVNLLSLPVNIFEKLAREPEKVPVNVS